MAEAGVPDTLERLAGAVAGAIADDRIGAARSVRLSLCVAEPADLSHQLDAALAMIDGWFGRERLSTRCMCSEQFRSGLALWAGGQIAVVSVFAGPAPHVGLLVLGSAGSISYERAA